MKRENFIISFGMFTIVKFKWNSAIRETEKIIKEIAIAENQNYTLTDSESIKDGSYHVSGFREWTGDDGTIIKFTIKKE